MRTAALLLFCLAAPHGFSADANAVITLARDGNWLVIRTPQAPGGVIRVNFLEAYCRADSTDADWTSHTVIPHTSQVVAAAADGSRLELRDTLADGVVVDHVIRAGRDEVDFRTVARNPTGARSDAHWAQPCVRLSGFLGFDERTALNSEDHLPRCFILLDGKIARLPTQPWATTARYTPGQAWCPAHVPRTDVNPRPLSPLVPSCGLIGCFSADDRWLFATAWEPYQELFQGIIRCLHSDFRIGGLQPGERKEIRGRIYIVPNDPRALLERYERDFPEHKAGTS